MICRSWNAAGQVQILIAIYLELQGTAQLVAIPCPPMYLPWNHYDLLVKKWNLWKCIKVTDYKFSPNESEQYRLMASKDYNRDFSYVF